MGLLDGIVKTIESPFKDIGKLAGDLSHGDFGSMLKDGLNLGMDTFKMDNPLGIATSVGMNSLSPSHH